MHTGRLHIQTGSPALFALVGCLHIYLAFTLCLSYLRCLPGALGVPGQVAAVAAWRPADRPARPFRLPVRPLASQAQPAAAAPALPAARRQAAGRTASEVSRHYPALTIVAPFAVSLIDQAVQNPYNGIAQLLNACVVRPVNALLGAGGSNARLSEAPGLFIVAESAYATGSVLWLAQVAGKSVGLTLALMIFLEVASRLANSRALFPALERLRKISLCRTPEARMAATGGLFMALCWPEAGTEPASFAIRLGNGLVGAAIFGTGMASYCLCRQAGGLSKFADDCADRTSFLSEFARLLLPGLLAGIAGFSLAQLSGAPGCGWPLDDYIAVFGLLGVVASVERLNRVARGAMTFFPQQDRMSTIERLRRCRPFFCLEVTYTGKSLAERFKNRLARAWHKPFMTGPLQETFWARRLASRHGFGAPLSPERDQDLDFDRSRYHSLDIVDSPVIAFVKNQMRQSRPGHGRHQHGGRAAFELSRA